MCKKITAKFLPGLFASLMFLLPAAAENPASVLVIDNYSSVYDITGKPLIKMLLNDDARAASPQYDDKALPVVSFPVGSGMNIPDYTPVIWYRMHFKLPADYPMLSIGISLGTVSDTDILYLNGTEIGRTGSEFPHHVPAYDKKRIYEFPSHLLLPGKDNVLSLRVREFFSRVNGPDSGPVEIAPMHLLFRDFMLKEMLDMGFITGYFIIVLYFAFIFIRKTIDREYLFFALFAAFSALYLFLRTQTKYFITDDFVLLKRIEYLILFFIPVFMLEYMTYYYEKRHHVLHYAAAACAVVSAAAAFISPRVVDWNTVLLYVAEPSWIVILGYCLYLAVRNFKNGNDAKYQLFSYITVMLFFINDVLYDRGVISTMRLSTYGFLVVIIGTTIIMRNRYRRIYESAESTSSVRRRGHTLISPDNRDKLDKAKAYISQNYTSEISRENLAASIGMHEDYFGKLFKQYTGLKIGDYINQLRIEESCRLILDENVKVVDVAFSVGFESLSTFYRAFQTVKKLSPGDWLERNKKTGEALS